MNWKLGFLFVAVVPLLAWNHSEVDRFPYLGTKTLYRPHQHPDTYEHPPALCKPIYVSLLSRHGSRTVSSRKSYKHAYKVFHQAHKDDNLSKKGRHAYKWMQELEALPELGLLTKEGVKQQYALGKRLGAWNNDFFLNKKVLMTSTYVKRTQQSLAAFQRGLRDAVGGAIDFQVSRGGKCEDFQLRYFDNCSRYRRYFNGKMKERREAIQSKVVDKPGFKRMVSDHFDVFFKDRNLGKVPGGAEVQTIEDLFELCQNDYNMNEKTGEDHFCAYLSRELRRDFVFVKDDLASYYKLGPVKAFDDPQDQGVTYKMACTAVSSFLEDMEAVTHGRSDSVAHLRFAHLETVMPVAILMGLFGTDKDLDVKEDPQWISDNIAGMGSNIRWLAYQCGEGELASYKVKMFYDEQEQHFPIPACQNSYFCDWRDVKAYYRDRFETLGLGACTLPEWNRICDNGDDNGRAQCQSYHREIDLEDQDDS